MSRIRLYIATSEGPVQIQRILAENVLDETEPSAVCLNGTHTRLGITKAYTFFVRDHVRAFSGTGVYRMDLDARIDGGDSWMLGAWIAHKLLHAERLSSHNDHAEISVFATGEIAFGAGADRTLEVRQVGHIPDKIRLMADRMAAEAAAGRRVLFLAPRANADDARVEIAKLPASTQESFSFHDVANAEDVSALVGLDELDDAHPGSTAIVGQPDADTTSVVATPARRVRRGMILAFLALLAVGASGGGYFALNKYEDNWQALWQQGRYTDLIVALEAAPMAFMADRFRASLTRNAIAAVPIAVFARRPADGGSCAGLRFRTGSVVSARVAPASGEAASGKRYVLGNPRTLCGFEVRAGEAGLPSSGRLWLALLRENGDDAREAILPTRRLTGDSSDAGPIALTQDLPLYQRDNWSWRVLALRTPGPSAELERMFGEKAAEFSVGALEALTTLGIASGQARIGLSEAGLNSRRR